MSTMRSTAWLAAISIAALVILAPASALAVERTVSVQGEAKVLVPNDSAGLGFSVTEVRAKRSAALHAVATRLRAVIATVRAAPGVGEGDVTTGRISVDTVTRHGHRAFRAGEGIQVTLHLPESAGELVTAAIAAGATGTRGPNFFVGNSAAAYNGALVAAFDQAEERAAALAARAGASLGQVISIVEGGAVTPEITESPPKATSRCGSSPAASPVHPRCAATPPVNPGTSTVTATVHAVFALL